MQTLARSPDDSREDVERLRRRVAELEAEVARLKGDQVAASPHPENIDGKRAEALLTNEAQILLQIVEDVPLGTILESLVLAVERLSDGMLGSILLLDDDGQTLRHGAAPSLPNDYNRLVDGLLIGPGVGSCGTAAFRKASVVVSDIAADPLWAPYRAIAESFVLRACWSTPLLSSSGRVLGTFAQYYRDVRSPTAAEKFLIQRATHLATIAIERTRARETMRRTAERFSMLLDHVRVIAWEGDCATRRFTFVSEQAEAISGYPPEEWTTFDFWEAHIHPDDRARAVHYCEERSQRGESHEFEYRWLCPQGRVIWIRDMVAVEMEGATLRRLYGIMMDVTERKRTEQALIESERRYRTLFEHAPDAVLTMDVDTGRFVDLNENAVRLFGHPRHVLYQVGPAEVSPPLQPDGRPSREAAQERVSQALAGATPAFEWTHRNAAGQDFPCEVRLVRLPSIGRNLVRGSITDITARKQAEQERQAHLTFLTGLDRVHRAIQGTNDLDQMMSDVLGVVLRIFDCDRAWLMYPCDPNAGTWRVPMERTRPEYPGAFALGVDLPMNAAALPLLQAALSAEEPVRVVQGSGHSVPADLADRFHIQSTLAMAIYPKGDKPYLFGLHQCSYPRTWTHQETQLFQAIGRRLSDALTSLLAHRNLRQSEAHLEDAQRIAHVGHWERDLETDRITWSDETCRIFGLRPRQDGLTLERLGELIHPEDRSIMTAAVAAALQGGPRYDVEYRARRPNGEVRFIHSHGDVTWDRTGRPLRMFGTVQDVTERKQAEAALRDSQRFLRSLAEASPHWIYVFDFDLMGVTYVNRPIFLDLGYTPEKHSFGMDLNGFRTFMPPEEQPHLEQVMVEWCNLPDGQMREDEYLLCHADGSTLCFSGREIVFLRRPDGSVRQILGSLSDITERKWAEANLRKERDFSESLIESLPGLAYLIDSQGRILRWNKYVERVTGYSPEEIAAMSPMDFVAPEELPRMAREMQETFERGHNVTETTIRTRNDERIPHLFSALRILRDGTPLLLGLGIDITDRKLAEEKVRRLNIELEERVQQRTAQLQAANSELEAFSYSVSHDLRAPLRAISGFCDILQRSHATAFPPDAARYLGRVQANVQQMGQLIDDLLAFSRLSRQPLRTQAVAPARIVGQALEELRAEQQGRQVQILVGALPMCQSDPALLKRVFVNLIGNALKYSRDRSPAVIEISSRPGDVTGEHVYFVKDNGVGFDMKYAGKLFGVFQRLHRAEDYEGTGVGLAMVQRIIHRHGGRIWAEAEAEKGATFFFTLMGCPPEEVPTIRSER